MLLLYAKSDKKSIKKQYYLKKCDKGSIIFMLTLKRRNKMKVNLNSLTKDEIEELQNFVNTKIKKESKDVNRFFNDLISGKLKNKNIDIDALDFIYSGLSEMVDSWTKNQPQMSEIEKIVCGPNTMIGRFLKTYNKKQISFSAGIDMLKKAGTFSETIMAVSDTYTRRNSFELGDHDLTHTQRVILNAAMIMNLRNELSERERKIIYTAAEFHDTGRVHDYEDKFHGERAVQKFSHELDSFSEEEQDLIKFMIIQHCKSTSENEMAIQALNKSEEEKAKYRLFLNYLKDADKLDRVRFPELIPMLSDSLDPNRLYFDESKQLIKFACESLENSTDLFKVKNSKTKEDLFRRDRIFAEAETGEELIESVNEVLQKNGYPERSKNLKLKKLKPQNNKFIKDGYIYLLRGTKKGQSSGFFTYPYVNDKKNVEQYLREHPKVNADYLASQQSMKGRERFISTTTDITVAAQFTALNLEKRTSGSIYVLKVKPEDAFRVVSPIAHDMFFGAKDSGDESEYLIPDFVKPEEILKEFKYNDYQGIYDYLKNEIGLNITKSDINLRENVAQQPELSDKMLNQLRKLNESNNQYWKQSDVAGMGFQFLTEAVNNGNGKTTLERVLNAIFDPHDDNQR